MLCTHTSLLVSDVLHHKWIHQIIGPHLKVFIIVVRETHIDMKITITQMAIANCSKTVLLFSGESCGLFNELSRLDNTVIVVSWLETNIILKTVTHSNTLYRDMFTDVPYLIKLLSILSNNTINDQIFSRLKQGEKSFNIWV